MKAAVLFAAGACSWISSVPSRSSRARDAKLAELIECGLAYLISWRAATNLFFRISSFSLLSTSSLNKSQSKLTHRHDLAPLSYIHCFGRKSPDTSVLHCKLKSAATEAFPRLILSCTSILPHHPSSVAFFPDSSSARPRTWVEDRRKVPSQEGDEDMSLHFFSAGVAAA